MLAWLGGKQKLVEKAKARQRVRAAAAAAGGGGSVGGAFTLHAGTAASRPIKRCATDEQEPAPTFLAAMPASGAQRGGRPPLAPAPGSNREPRQPRLKRVKASLDLVALEMPAWQPTGAAEGDGSSEGAAAIMAAGSGSGAEGDLAGEGGGGTQDEPQRPPAAAMQVP